MDWWQQPYRGGPMISVPGFPRPLYPPDASAQGKRPSTSGPDVEAYKRVAWRLGRWPGPATRFDQAYSDGFSHGSGGDVVETGIAGMQRQANIQDTGWVGKQTFNFMRSVLIPAGFDGPGKAGEYAMDAYAQSLIVQAWELFEGKEPKPEPAPELQVRQAAMARAQSQLGYKEQPAGSNNTKYGSWYGMNYSPWCAMFVTWCYELGAQDCGLGSPTFEAGKTYAYVPYLVSDARNNLNGLQVTSSPIGGDLVCFDWQGDGCFDHIGLFENFTSGRVFDCLEGNTSTSDDSNGGEVMRRQRDASTIPGLVFCRVAEP